MLAMVIPANREDTAFLRFMAICLILNSHLDLYYPIPHVGTGGAIGNALFFALSSFGLFLSETRKPQSFIIYCFKRIKRIYPSVWLVLLMFVLPAKLYKKGIDLYGVISFLKDCLAPPFWFLQALIIYYIIGFLLIKKFSKLRLTIFFCIALMSYLYVYLNFIDLSIWSVENFPFKLIFYLMVFMFGILLADTNEKINFSGTVDIIICSVLVCVLYGHKYLMTKNLFSNFQAIQQMILFPIIYYLFKISRSSFVIDGIMQMPVLGKAIMFVSSITLELYIVHASISPYILHQKFKFPENIIIFLALSFSISAVIKWASNKVPVLIDTR
jgi:peptidoglycan/LPS O-acetylase OafA/YrhL